MLRITDFISLRFTNDKGPIEERRGVKLRERKVMMH
jgi:hypothetical protein